MASNRAGKRPLAGHHRRAAYSRASWRNTNQKVGAVKHAGVSKDRVKLVSGDSFCLLEHMRGKT
jgi:hypothetical protein